MTETEAGEHFASVSFSTLHRNLSITKTRRAALSKLSRPTMDA
jgi:hypothetical protein